MAIRRGPNSTERLATDTIVATADSLIVASPCFVYSLTFSVQNTNATGAASVSDTSATADILKDPNLARIRLGSLGASGGANTPVTVPFNVPVYVRNQVGVQASGMDVTVRYLAAS